MTAIKILINGAKGKMGALSATTLTNHPNFNVVACCDKDDPLNEAINATSPDVVLDFTTPQTVFQNSQIIIEQRVAPVIGTTGLTEDELKVLTEQCADKKLGGLIVPNFSLGANLMMHLSTLAAKYYNNVEITERHHEKKIDSPSGTALHTAKLIKETHTQYEKTTNASLNSKSPHADTYQRVPIHSLRLQGSIAHQSVIFGAEGENLTISHDANDRQCFMPGMILACQAVVNMKELKIGLNSLLP